MELIIHSPSEDGFIKSIDFNHEELKKELALRLEKYQGLTYGDTEIKIAKADRATLNKFKDALDSKRKEIKKQCLAPYEDFETKLKEITTLVDKPIKEIDAQVKAYEEKQKEDKKKTILDIYKDHIGNLEKILPIEKLWNEKWLNVTYKYSDIEWELKTNVEKVQKDLVVIQELNSEFELQIKDKYIQTLDLSTALSEKTRLEEQKAKLEEQKAKLEEQKAKLEEYAKLQENKKIEEAPNVIDASKDEKTTQKPTLEERLEQEQLIPKELEVIEFKLWVTPEQKQFLRNYILENKIKCGKVR